MGGLFLAMFRHIGSKSTHTPGVDFINWKIYLIELFYDHRKNTGI